MSKNNKIVSKYLGLSYFFKNNYQNAAYYLTKAGVEDKLGLLNFISNIDNIEFVPDKIYKYNRSKKVKSFISKFNSDTINIPQNLILEFNKAASDLPAQYTILELGSNIGLLGYEINKRMQDEYIIYSTEISKEMINLQTDLFQGQQFYDIVLTESVKTYLADNSQKYDVIFSLDGLSNIKNLQSIFANISSTLNNNGYFAFCLRTSKNAEFSRDLLEFSYDIDQISKNLLETGFKILSFKNFNLENKNNYTIFVCKQQI